MQSHFYRQIYHLEEYYWWYRSRRNLVKQFLPSGKQLKILDIGCGTGKLMEVLQDYGEIYGIDASQQAINFCRQRHLEHVYRNKFPDSKHLGSKRFNVIICLDVIEHIFNDTKAMATINQLLSSGGRLILTVPAYSWLFSYWDQASGHYRRFSLAQITQLIEACGLKLVKTSYLYSFLMPIAIPFRLIKHHLFLNQVPPSDLVKLPWLINKLLFGLATLEQLLLSYIHLPFGLSIVCIAEKP